jgi:hypothetical protein
MDRPLDQFPGGDLVLQGIVDLEHRRETIESLLVSIGAPRLRHAGLAFGQTFDDPEHRLYHLLAATDSDSAHSRYNAYIRRLVSFERAIECAA